LKKNILVYFLEELTDVSKEFSASIFKAVEEEYISLLPPSSRQLKMNILVYLL